MVSCVPKETEMVMYLCNQRQLQSFQASQLRNSHMRPQEGDWCAEGQSRFRTQRRKVVIYVKREENWLPESYTLFLQFFSTVLKCLETYTSCSGMYHLRYSWFGFAKDSNTARLVLVLKQFCYAKFSVCVQGNKSPLLPSAF